MDNIIVYSPFRYVRHTSRPPSELAYPFEDTSPPW